MADKLIRCVRCGEWAKVSTAPNEPRRYGLCEKCRSEGVKFVHEGEGFIMVWYYEETGNPMRPCRADADRFKKRKKSQMVNPNQGRLFNAGGHDADGADKGHSPTG